MYFLVWFQKSKNVLVSFVFFLISTFIVLRFPKKLLENFQHYLLLLNNELKTYFIDFF